VGLFDRVTVEVLSAAFQTKQLGEGMLTYQLAADGRLVAPCGVVVAYHGLLHLVGEDGAEFMAVFTHGRLEVLDPIVEEIGDNYRCLGRGVLGNLEAPQGSRHDRAAASASDEDGTLPPDTRTPQPQAGMSRQAALRLAQEAGKAVAHCCLAFMEIQAGGWPLPSVAGAGNSRAHARRLGSGRAA
jgi:hypothetical protein